MVTAVAVVPEDPQKPGRDVLGSAFVDRGHFIHEVMARAAQPLSLKDISEQAKRLADAAGYQYRTADEKAFTTVVTGNHLRQWLKRSGYAEQLPDKRWQLTPRARQRIETARNGAVDEMATRATNSQATPDVRTVDAKSRVVLPAEFVGATVMIERVGENEVRIRRAVVVPVDEFPLIEDQLKPLSDRDRDLFLSLLDNPPEPTPAFLKAAKEYKKRHG